MDEATIRQGSHRCPLCRKRMRVLPLPGPHGRAVEVDHCAGCRQVWFDALELHTLAQPGWVRLLAELAQPAGEPPPPLADPRCPRCGERLTASEQVGDFGRSARLACPNGHGEARHDGALLASRGLFRTLRLDERVALATERRRLHCLPCGAPLQGESGACTFCGSPATVVDLPRLRQALGLPAPSPGDAPLMPWPCHGCGAMLDAGSQPACPQCRHPVLAPALADLPPLLEAAREQAARREREAAAATLRVVAPGQRQRVSALTGRPEHRLAMQALQGRYWRRWAGLVVATLLLMLAAKCSAQTSRPDMHNGRYIGDHAGPAALDSPGWRDLMALPVVEDDTLAYHAAAVAARWGRAEEAGQLQATLLLLHGQALAGANLPARVGQLLGQPIPERAALQAAWDAGLTSAFAQARWDGPPPAPAPTGAEPWAPRAGFWRLPAGRLAVQAELRNDSRFVVVPPGPLQLVLQTPAGELAMPCTLRPSRVRWLPGEAARAWCESPSAVSREGWAALREARARWHGLLPATEAMQAWADLLAGRQPVGVGLLLDRHAHCRDLKNCRQGPVPTTEELAAWQREAREKDAEHRVRERARERRDSRSRSWSLLAWLVGGFAVYVLAARLLGALLASGLIVALSVAVSLWAFANVRGNGWGGLALLIIGIGAPVYGLALAAGYRWLYKRFFAPE